MTDCKYCQDEICVNAECQMRADYCPVPDIEGVCRFEDRAYGTRKQYDPEWKKRMMQKFVGRRSGENG